MSFRNQILRGFGHRGLIPGRRQLLRGMAATSAAAGLGLGLSPFASRPAQGALTGFTFVSNEKSHEVTVLAPETYEIANKIPTSRRPRGMVFNAEHSLLYVACGDEDVVDIIDVAEQRVVDGIPTGPSPEVLTISPDEKLMFIANEEDSSMWIINVDDRVLQHEVPSGAEPEGVMVTPDGKTVYLTSEVADMVHRVDVEQGIITANVIVGTRPRRIRITPDQKEMWVSCELSGEVYIIDIASYQVTDVINFLPPGFRQVDVTPVGLELNAAGTRAYVTLGRANHLAYVDIATREITDYILVGSRAWGITITRDETTILVANGLSDDISVIDEASRRVLKSVRVGRVPYIPLIDDREGWSPVGN
ncbi:MAG: PQQ-dependent catabolism-associated beta-propeller protein [Proteobacteria bacterium]|nr:PQQ-dependent catabolism-associated beta-propeller protein [Pseudomonadota bacterium]MDA1132192.1 PQQ-dependent catabolism-associated beta-propeller protein [Pseudomonadota bacterium]